MEPPSAPPAWARAYLPDCSDDFVGVEVFAGSEVLTKIFRSCGSVMFDAIELVKGAEFDVMKKSVLLLMSFPNLRWAWFAPPCSSFSPLRNLDVGGPLRPLGNPEGDSGNPEVSLGNRLWGRTLRLAGILLDRGGFVAIEHPLNSSAWKLRMTQQFIDKYKFLKLVRVDQCAYGSLTMKPTRILTNAPWVISSARLCPKNHVHAEPLRGLKARQAASYPPMWIRTMQHAQEEWRRSR